MGLKRGGNGVKNTTPFSSRLTTWRRKVTKTTVLEAKKSQKQLCWALLSYSSLGARQGTDRPPRASWLPPVTQCCQEDHNFILLLHTGATGNHSLYLVLVRNKQKEMDRPVDEAHLRAEGIVIRDQVWIPKLSHFPYTNHCFHFTNPFNYIIPIFLCISKYLGWTIFFPFFV